MQAQPTPLANRLLIALPALVDPHFVRSVALVCQHDEEGAMGVLVNRPSEFTLGDVFEQMGIETGDETLRSQIVLSGGPVHPERGFVLHDGGEGWDSTLAVSDRLYVTTSRDILEAMAGGTGPKNAVVALGCAGWGAGQLEQELTEDTWLSVPVDAGLLFETPLDARWRAAAGTLGVDITQLADHSGHA